MDHTLTEEDIDAITERLGDDIAKIYGFTLPGQTKTHERSDARWTDHCVCCGNIMPEGRMVCPQCERQEIRGADKKSAICAFLKEHHTGKSRAIPQ